MDRPLLYKWGLKSLVGYNPERAICDAIYRMDACGILRKDGEVMQLIMRNARTHTGIVNVQSSIYIRQHATGNNNAL